MSRENIDRLREGYELSNRGDFDGVVARVHRDFVYENDPVGPLGATVYYGRGAVKGFWEDFLGSAPLRLHPPVDAPRRYA